MPSPIFHHEQHLAEYSSKSNNSIGRLYPEDSSYQATNRTIWQRDRDRIIHSSAFRRLEYKTQVFANDTGDHYRTRLTHSIEVSQLARSIARHLHANEDLTEAIALGHDLGHPPFGHAGENGLNYAMSNWQAQNMGGFDHNAHSLRIITKLEQKYFAFDGLNLSWEVVEGLAKHNGPVIPQNDSQIRANNLPWALQIVADEWQLAGKPLDLDKFSSLEAQIAAIADDIAYHNHDIEDGIRAKLFGIEQLYDLPIIGEFIQQNYHRNIRIRRLLHEALRRMMSQMIIDVVSHTKNNITLLEKQLGHIPTNNDIRNSSRITCDFSKDFQEIIALLRSFLTTNMYHHPEVNIMSSRAKRITKGLFDFYMNESSCLPERWQQEIANYQQQYAQFAPEKICAMAVSDYIAGMTDRFAIQQINKIGLAI